MSRAAILLRIAGLPLVVLAGFVLYGQAVIAAGWLMPLPARGDLVLPVLISQGFLAATFNAAVVCVPLARLYGRAALAVATLIALPVLAVSLHGAGGGRPFATWRHAWELFSYVALTLGATWLAQRRRAGRSAC